MKYQNQFTRDKKRPRYCDSNEVVCDGLSIFVILDTHGREVVEAREVVFVDP